MKQQQQQAVCPVEMALSIVGGKWKLQILYCLLSGTKRFGQLQRLIPRATQQMLTMQLRELEQAGIIHRQVYAQVPPKVEYSLTELGRSLEPIVHQIHSWGEWYCEQNDIEYWQISDHMEAHIPAWDQRRTRHMRGEKMMGDHLPLQLYSTIDLFESTSGQRC